MLDAEAQQTPIMSLGGIKRAKVEGFEEEKRVVTFIESYPKEL